MRCTGFVPRIAAALFLTGVAACVYDADPDLDSAAAPLDTTAFGPRVPLAEVAAVTPLAEACPPARLDALCTALNAGDDAGARAAAAGLVARDRSAARRDAAVRYFLRERLVTLVVWNAVTDLGRQPAPADPAAAAALIAAHYPIYDDGVQLAMARRGLPPLDAAGCASRDVLVFYPGVFRVGGRAEYTAQIAAIRDALPCLDSVVIDTDDFIDPAINAELGRSQLAAIDRSRRLHLVGYSQGVRNALQLLVDDPAVAARTDSVLALSSSAHGSEAVDTLFLAMRAFEQARTVCGALPTLARAACERVWAEAQPPAEVLIDIAAGALAIPAAALGDVAGLDAVAALRALHDRLAAKIAGFRSLTTFGSAEFWDQRGDQLPTDVLYTSFRSVITDTRRNMPLSNAPLYYLLALAGGAEPYNDMQIRLANHALGGPVAATEVVLPAAEGNHWQWALTPGLVPELLMPAEMAARAPQSALLVAYLQTLFEVGLID